MIQDQIAKKGMSDQFEEIVVPVIEVPEIKRGKQVITEKKFMLVNHFTLLTPLIAININCTSVFIGVQISQDLD